MIQLVQELLACRVDLGEMIVVNGSSSVTVIRHMKHSKVKVGKCAFIHGPYLTSRANASCQQHPLTFIWIENICQILEKVILKTEFVSLPQCMPGTCPHRALGGGGYWPGDRNVNN